MRAEDGGAGGGSGRKKRQDTKVGIHGKGMRVEQVIMEKVKTQGGKGLAMNMYERRIKRD